jgi:hypothetical protein
LVSEKLTLQLPDTLVHVCVLVVGAVDVEPGAAQPYSNDDAEGDPGARVMLKPRLSMWSVAEGASSAAVSICGLEGGGGVPPVPLPAGQFLPSGNTGPIPGMSTWLIS